MGNDDERSLGDAATYAGRPKPQQPDRDISIGNERTLGGGDAVGVDTVIDDIEILDLENRWKIEGTLGQGGMGAVLLATDTRLGRKVAVKRILGEAARSKTAIMRFLTEAKAIAALNHPNIVQIYEFGRAKDGPFLIMEYVDGGSLLDRCRDGAMPLEAAVDLACQLCDGLAKAHDAGIVHRDIKPANVLLNKDGLPKLTDFGLAKAESADHGMTMTGAVMGTPDFMPPEQRRDASLVDHRSDLWSLAATVYQIVTGRSPKIIRFNDVPAALQDVLAKALEEDKDARYQSAREFRDALKTSVRAAAVVVAARGEGVCPSCGVKNDLRRRYCGGCGKSLEADCLSCKKPMPVWEEICGECGAKQTPLVQEKRAAMAARQAEAEGLLGDLHFDRAKALADELVKEGHPRLNHLTEWADTFLKHVEETRAQQNQHAHDLFVEAQKHEAACDYQAAIISLEVVPHALRGSALPGAQETVTEALRRVRGKQRDAERLEAEIKNRLDAKELDGLLSSVEALLVLRPDRKDLLKIRTQLTERVERQVRARTEAVSLANGRRDKHDYAGALKALRDVPAAAVNREVTELREQLAVALSRSEELLAQINRQKIAKQFDDLRITVDEYLALQPADPDVLALQQSLIARDEKIKAEVTAIMDKARSLAASCRFGEAAALLAKIPDHRRPRPAKRQLGQYLDLQEKRQAAAAAIKAAGPRSYEQAIETASEYQALLIGYGTTDAEFATALQSLREKCKAHRESQRRIAVASRLIAAGTVAVLLLMTGLWLRSSWRAMAIRGALAEGRWDDALSRDPKNLAALVGRARSRLTVTPVDLPAGRADLRQLEGMASRAAADQLNELRAIVRLHEARELFDQGQREKSLKLADELLILSPAAARAALALPECGPFRTAVVDDHHNRFEQSLAAGRISDAIKAAAGVGEIEPAAQGWLTQGLTGEKLRALPPSAWAAMPAEIISALPGSVIADLPAAALKSLPAAAILALPPIQNSIGMELKLLPPGVFTMGDEGNKDDAIRRVTLTRPFFIGVHEVTNAQWSAATETDVPSPWKDGSLPVANADWDDADFFCGRLAQLPDEAKKGRFYRLPTEAEWEYACRAGTSTPMFFGSDTSQLENYAWFADNSGRRPLKSRAIQALDVNERVELLKGNDCRTHPVGSKQPNPWGLYDMYGNVWEWCGDWHEKLSSSAAADPVGPNSGQYRVIRGGSFSDPVDAYRSGLRGAGPPRMKAYQAGFRVVLQVP